MWEKANKSREKMCFKQIHQNELPVFVAHLLHLQVFFHILPQSFSFSFFSLNNFLLSLVLFCFLGSFLSLAKTAVSKPRGLPNCPLVSPLLVISLSLKWVKFADITTLELLVLYVTQFTCQCVIQYGCHSAAFQPKLGIWLMSTILENVYNGNEISILYIQRINTLHVACNVCLKQSFVICRLK